MNDAAAINRWTPAINRLEENRLIDESMLIIWSIHRLFCSSVGFRILQFATLWVFIFQISLDYFLVALIMSSDVSDFVIMRMVGLIGSMIVQALPFNTALGVDLGI